MSEDSTQTKLLRGFNPQIGASLTVAATLAMFLLFRQNSQTNNRLKSLSEEFKTSAIELSSLKNKTSALEEELANAQKVITLLRDRRIPAGEVSFSLVAIGVEWNDAPNKNSYQWYGTGFAITDSEWFATAGHVIHKAESEHANLQKRGVPSRVIARFSDSAISFVKQTKSHPLFKRDDSRSDEPSADLALFLTEPQRSVKRLTLAMSPTPKIGDEVFVAGFPRSVPQIRYSIHSDEPFVPTFRCGRVERLIDINDLTKSSRRDLLQLDIPLVGGFSGSPVMNFDGEVVGIATFASHRHIEAREADTSLPSLSKTIRLLDPAHVSFAVSKTLLEGMLEDLKKNPPTSQSTTFKAREISTP